MAASGAEARVFPIPTSLAGMHPHAGRRTRLIIRAALSVGTAGLALVAAGLPAAATSTASVLQKTKAAIGAEISAHVVFLGRSSSTNSPEKIVADVSGNSGSETVSEGTAQVKVRVTPTAGYISGSASGLTKLFGLTAAQAKKVGTDWVSEKPGTNQYKALKADVTIGSVKALLPTAKVATLTNGTRNGASVYVLHWTIAASSSTPKLTNTLTVARGKSLLPLEEVSTASGGLKVSTTLSKWGESVTVVDPPASMTMDASAVTG